jgi:enamine deaminase RidA (YjgF/YER057c/UK114 family)
MAEIQIFNPEALGTPRAPYSLVASVAPGSRLIAIAGQVAVGRDGKVVGKGDIEQQAAQVFANMGECLQAAGADWKHIIQFMSFLTRRQDIPGFFSYRQREFPKLFAGGAYPPNTLLIVNGLADEDMILEVQAVAAV